MSMTGTRGCVGMVAAAVLALAGGAGAQPAAEMGPQAALTAMGVVGYADRMSVAPGETIRFMVSSQLPTYRAEIVRLIPRRREPQRAGDQGGAGRDAGQRRLSRPAPGPAAGSYGHRAGRGTAAPRRELHDHGLGGADAPRRRRLGGGAGRAGRGDEVGGGPRLRPGDRRAGAAGSLARGGRWRGGARGGRARAPAVGAGHSGCGAAAAPRCADAVVLRGRELRRRYRPGDAVPGAARPLRERSDAGGRGGDDAGACAGDARRAVAHGGLRDPRRRRGGSLQREDRQPADLRPGAEPHRGGGDRGRRSRSQRCRGQCRAGRRRGGVGLRGGHRDRPRARHRGGAGSTAAP